VIGVGSGDGVGGGIGVGVGVTGEEMQEIRPKMIASIEKVSMFFIVPLLIKL
jgi:hypothetical protein